MSKRRRPKFGSPLPKSASTSVEADDTPLRSVAHRSSSLLSHALALTTIAILSLAAIRCLVPITPNAYWDTNPVQASASSETGSQPARLSFDVGEAAWLDVLAFVVAGVGLFLHVKAGGRVHRWSVLLVAVGLAFCAMQMPTHIESLYKCGAWMASAVLALAAFHLAQRSELRRWFVAVLIALAFPMAIDAVWYVAVDHPFMVDMFTEKEAEWLQSRGWAEGSPQHLQYRRRLEFNDATGAFSFSNVLGSVMASLAMLALCVGWGGWQSRKRPGEKAGWWKVLLPGLFGVAALVTVWLTNSKGAAIATVMVLGLFALIVVATKRIGLRRWIAPAATALVFIAVLVVIVRGLAGPPETSAGERSLLFRWHYWQAASRMVTADAGTLLTGVSPGDYQLRYAAAKNPLNPEEVSSSHNVFIDQIAMLGIGGWAWTVLMFGWLWAAGSRVSNRLGEGESEVAQCEDHAEPNAKPWQIENRTMLFAALLAALVMGGQLFMRWAGVDIVRFPVWAVGMMAFLFGTALLVARDWMDQRWADIGLFLAASLLLVHNQIEMSFHQPGSAPIAWLVLAVAAATKYETATVDSTDEIEGANGEANASAWLHFVPAIICLVAVVPLARLYAYPLSAEQSAMAAADRNLRTSQLSIPTLLRAVEDLHVAEQALPIDPRPYEWQVRLRMSAAGMTFVQINRSTPARQRNAMFQFIAVQLNNSINTLKRASDAGLVDAKLLRLEAEASESATSLLSDPGGVTRAISVWEKLVEMKPFSWQDRLALADLYWKIGRRDEATQQYQRCLKLSEDAYLDEARQMPTVLLNKIGERLGSDKPTSRNPSSRKPDAETPGVSKPDAGNPVKR